MNLSAFTKMCGAGNDFLITDKNRWEQFLKNSGFHLEKQKTKEKLETNTNVFSREKIIRLCDRKFGLGADGLCYLQVKKNHSIEWSFYNSDGSIAPMCGNASCCIIDYVYRKKLIPSTVSLLNIFIDGKKIMGSLNADGTTRLFSPLPKILIDKSSIKFDGLGCEEVPFSKINSGVKHILIDVRNLSFYDKLDFLNDFSDEKLNLLKPLSKRLRNQEPDANITFYSHSKNNEAKGITFERGVEDFTLACGTGALAIGYHLMNSLNLKSDSNLLSSSAWKIKMRGGVLKASFDENYAYLQSPVHLIAEISSYIL